MNHEIVVSEVIVSSESECIGISIAIYLKFNFGYSCQPKEDILLFLSVDWFMIFAWAFNILNRMRKFSLPGKNLPG